MENQIKYLNEIVKARYNPLPKGCAGDDNSKEMKTVIFNLKWSTEEAEQRWQATIAIGKLGTCAWITYEGKGVLMQDAIDELESNIICGNPVISEIG